MFDLSRLPAAQRKFGEQIMKGAKNLILKELTLAISELQALEAEMSEDDFIIRSPSNYSHHQYQFLNPIMEGMGRVFVEQLEKIERGEIKVEEKKEEKK